MLNKSKITQKIYNSRIQYSFPTKDNDDPFSEYIVDKYCNDVFCLVSCNCIFDSIVLFRHFLLLDWLASMDRLEVAIEGGTSIRCPTIIHYTRVWNTTSIGDPGSVKTATE